jgi:hypothetical protein
LHQSNKEARETSGKSLHSHSASNDELEGQETTAASTGAAAQIGLLVHLMSVSGLQQHAAPADAPRSLLLSVVMFRAAKLQGGRICLQLLRLHLLLLLQLPTPMLNSTSKCPDGWTAKPIPNAL